MKQTLIAIICSLAAITANASPKLGTGDLKECKLEYPRASLMNEESGTVLVDIVVAGDGKVAEAKVMSSSGYKSLDISTVAMVKKCKIAKSAGAYSVEYVWSLG